jgi:hypothetical protein
MTLDSRWLPRSLRSLLCLLCLLSLLSCGPAPDPGERCQGLAPGALVITELMLDPAGVDTGAEWLELFNPGESPVELPGLTLFTQDVDGTKATSHVFRAGQVAGGGHLVAGDVRAEANPPWVDYAYSGELGALGNARGVVGLRCGTTLLDEARWTRAALAGRSRMLGATGLGPSSEANDAEAAWCDAPAELAYLAPNAGTPGEPNPPCGAQPEGPGTCLEDGLRRARRPAGPGDLLITEVMASPSGPDATGEWLELLAAADVDLNGLTLTSGSGATDTLDDERCLRVTPGQYALLARSDDGFLNGGLPEPLAVYSLSLAGTNERLSLRRGDAGVDEVAFLASSTGVAWQLNPERLDPARLDAQANDEPTGFCHAPRRWRPDGGGDHGSPGAPNPPCGDGGEAPPVDAGRSDGGAASPDVCLDAASRQPRPLRRPAWGDLVITEWMANPSAVTDALGEYLEVRANADVDLNDVVLGDGSTATRTLRSSDCLRAAAGTYLVFAVAQDASVNGGLPTVAGVLPFSLGNTADSLWLRGPDGGLLDSVSYDATQPGQSTQLASGLVGPQDNELAANLCPTPDAGSNRYGLGDLGTPGRANVSCPPR